MNRRNRTPPLSILIAITIASGFAAPVLHAQSPAKRPLQSADILRLRTIADPQRSPDGTWVAYTVTRADTAKDRNDSDVWMTRWDGTATVRLTFSDESEATPRWSPDGKQLSFISSRQGARGGQVWLLNIANGGEAEKITDLKGGVEDVVWAPDGKRLALIVNDPEPDPDSANARPKPIVVNKYAFKSDGRGYLGDVHARLWVYDLATRKGVQVTAGDADDSDPAWSPDGARIAFISKRAKDADRFNNLDVYVVNATDSANTTPQQRTTFPGGDLGPLSWSPDGTQIAYRQAQAPKDFGYDGGFGVVGLTPAAGGSPRLITAKYGLAITDARFAPDGRSIVGMVSDDMRDYLVRVSPTSGTVERINATMPSISAYSAGKDGGIAVVASSPTQPAELFALTATGMRQLTTLNPWMSEIALSTTETVSSTSDDGTEVHGMLRRPAGAAPGARLPLIVRIHGGPAAQSGFEFDFERELIAAQGYAVLAPNYRGSSGRGAAFTLAVSANWCNPEVRDIRGMIDHLVKTGVADESKLGVGGWSYGGILTDCLIAADQRFKAATSGAGVSNVLGMYGHDQYTVQYDLELGQPWKNVEKWLSLSKAFMNADKITTPTLFLGGAVDWNVPVLGGEQMYQALQSNHVPTELIVYPGETHSITRPSFKKDRLDRYIAWYAKYLGGPTVP